MGLRPNFCGKLLDKANEKICYYTCRIYMFNTGYGTDG